ncbi:MAG: hypothetical protein JWR26_2035 [Pedosphaera sp.]|nr:hypothetical protein [Pedosphaera sp.]
MNESDICRTLPPLRSTVRPAYLKFTTFTVTQSLMQKLSNFSPDIQEKMAFIQSVIISLSRKNRHPALYTNIGAKTFQNKCRDYRRMIEQMVALGELDVNEVYQQGRFTKSYRIPKSALDSGLITFGAKKKRIRKPKDKTNIFNPNIEHQRKCLEELSIKDSYISTGDELTDARAKAALLNIQQGNGNFTQGGKGGRIFNSVLQVPREARCNIEHRQGHDLAEFDIRGCHPFLIIDWCEPQEREAYASLVSDPSTDIYNYVAAEMRSKKSRDDLKIDMMIYINGGGHTIFDDFFSKNFPALNKTIKAGGKSNAAKLQKFEAEIMMKLGAWCAEQNLFFIVQHDGWVGRKDQGEVVSEKLKELVLARIGFRPNIDKKERFTNTKNRVSVSSSYVMHKQQGKRFPDWLLSKIEAERARKYQRNKFLVCDEPSPDGEPETL